MWVSFWGFCFEVEVEVGNSGSRVLTIFFYKGSRNPEIGNTPVWVFPNIWRLGWVRDTNFVANVSSKMLGNAAKCNGYSFYRFRVITRKPTGAVKLSPTPRLGLRSPWTISCWRQDLSNSFWYIYLDSPTSLNFCIISLFLVNDPQTLKINPGCLCCILGMDLSPPDKNLFTVSCILCL